MIDWLYTLPDWLLILGTAAILAGLIIVLPHMTHRLPGLEPSVDHTDFVLRLQISIFSVAGLVITFTLIEAESTYHRVEAQVANEASTLNRLDRLLENLGQEAAGVVRPRLLTYARSIVVDEWPALMRSGKRGHPRTQASFVAMSHAILALRSAQGLEPAIHAELLRAFDNVAEARDERLNARTLALPATFWEAIVLVVAILLFVSSTIERTPFRTVILGCQMAVLGAFIGFVFVRDQPFRGQSAVDPQPIHQVIGLMERRNR